jgi:hypothetical protein
MLERALQKHGFGECRRRHLTRPRSLFSLDKRRQTKNGAELKDMPLVEERVEEAEPEAVTKDEGQACLDASPTDEPKEHKVSLCADQPAPLLAAGRCSENNLRLSLSLVVPHSSLVGAEGGAHGA